MAIWDVGKMVFHRTDGNGGTSNGTFIIGYEKAPSYPYEPEYLEKASYLRGLSGTLSRFLWWGDKRRWTLKFESLGSTTLHILGSHFFNDRRDESFHFVPSHLAPVAHANWFTCKLVEPWKVKLTYYDLWDMTVTFEEV